jgi:hypothetical protein
MQIYWSLKLIPELKDLPPRQRRKAWFTCVGKDRSWKIRLSGWLLTYIPIAISLLLAILINVYLGIAVLVLLLIPGLMIFNQIQSDSLRPYLKKYIEEQAKGVSGSEIGGGNGV